MKPSPRPVALAALFLASALGIAAFSRLASRRSNPTPAPETSTLESDAGAEPLAPFPEPPTTAPSAPTASPETPQAPTETTQKSAFTTRSAPVAPSPTPDAVPVRTAVATLADVETKRVFRGFTEVDPVEIVPRVRGFLESIEFQPGALVEAGDVLFRVESFDYQNDVDAAKAELAAAIARETRAKATHRRNLQLYKDKSVSGVVTEETLEESQTAWRAANAATAKARAALAAAEKQLERTVVRAPCRGQISRPFYPVGTFLDGAALNPPVLARLVAMDPMLVYFYATDREFLEFQQKRRDALKSRLGKRYDAKNYANVSLREALKAENLPDYIDFEARFPGLDDKGDYSRRGVVNYVDNQIDRSTGVVALRGEIPNPDYSIYPGAVCEVALSDEPVKNATLIDVKAVCSDLNSHFVWVVDENDVPRRRTVELGRKTENGAQVVATSGVKPGERYVVDGVLNLRPGLRVVEAAPRRIPASEPFAPETAVASKPDADATAPDAAETFRAAKPVVPATSPKRSNAPDDETSPKRSNGPNDETLPRRSNAPADATSPKRSNAPDDATSPKRPNSPDDATSLKRPNSPDDATSPKRANAPAHAAAFLNVNYADRAVSSNSNAPRDATKSPTPPPRRPASER